MTTGGTVIPIWLQYLQALSGPGATLIAAGTAAWITWIIQHRQLNVATEKLRIDLFEKRVSYFSETKKIIEAALGSEITSSEFNSLSNEFLLLGRKSKFLFGDDVNEFVDQVRKLMISLEADHTFISSSRGAGDQQEVRESIVNNRKLLREAFTKADLVFSPYLDFRNVRIR